MKSTKLIDNIELPKIINGLAKFDGRKKQYILYPEVIEKSGEARQREIILLATLQTKWEQLRQAYPDELNKLKLTTKYYRKACLFNKHSFLPITVAHHTIIIDERWLRWDQVLQQFEQDLYQRIQPLDLQGFSEFQTYVHDTIAQTCQTQKQIKQGYRAINRFIDYQNKHFMLIEHYYPNIVISLPKKINPLTININWVTRGKQVNKLVRAVHDDWQQTIDYSSDEILGWLLFSGIVYGGINDQQMLEGWFRALLNKEYQPFINQRLLVSFCFEQKGYGNERDAENNKLYNTQQVIVDMVSQCWLIRYHQQNSDKNSQEMCLQQPQKSAKEYLMSALAMVAKPLDLPILTFTQLLAYASYHWEMLEGADINQASVAVLCGKQNTAGLTKNSFAQFLYPVCQNTTINYDLDEILKLSINVPKKLQTVIVTQSKHTKKVRRSDLITAITKDFKLVESLKKKRLNYTPPTLVERLEKRCQQYTTISEQVFLCWVLMLLKEESSKAPKKSSILKYVKSIGYEWLYFTMGQSIDRWDEEDFETLYEDILEYKAVIRGNTDVSYSAKLLQRLHNFAHKKYGFSAVVISYEKSGRRVRAELVSPPIYHAIITKILSSVDILEREMFALMFILVYRTGMRKNELIGLKYIDIEGLEAFTPSVVVRNNSYRSLKTASSNRRIPIFALLKPNELAFFIRYVQSNIGVNPNKFIFTLSSAQSPIDDHVPLQLLRRILQDISGNDHTISYTFHAFRHTAVSNLSLVLNGDSELVESLTDYDTQDIYRIKSGLVGEHINAQDRWYALSGMMGHLSPQRSFEYYNHFATLMATYALSVTDIKLPSRVINNITGFDNKKLKQNHAVIENGDVSLPSIRALLTCSIFHHRRPSPQFFVDNTSPLIEPRDLSNSLFMRYGINHVWALLQQIDEDITPKQAAMTVKIDWYDAQILIDRAYKVAAIISTRGKPRFVKTMGIGPLSIQYQSDFRLLSSLQNSAQQLRRTSMDDWQWFMTICQHRLSSSRAFVPFLDKEQQALQRFIAIIKQLLPTKNWLIVTSTSYQTNADLTDIQDMRHISKAHINTINIGIATAEDRKSARHKTNWKFSPLLRFFVHMMLITDDSLSIINTQIEHTSQND